MVGASRWSAGALCALALAACGAPETDRDGSTGDGRAGDARQSAAPTTTISPSQATGYTVTAGSPDVDQEAVTLIQDLVAFAVAPGPVTLRGVPLAPTDVRLGLGPTLIASLDLAGAADPTAWQLTMDPYSRAYTGTFSALETIRRHVEGTVADTGPVRRPGALRVSVGEHPHCAAPPMPAPEGLAGMRRVSVQPDNRSITSCLDWFTVDLFLDGALIVAVTLDLWEP